MATLNVTVADADLAAVDAVWTAAGYVGLAGRLQAFADDEVASARKLARAAAVAAAKNETELKQALYDEYQAKVS